MAQGPNVWGSICVPLEVMMAQLGHMDRETSLVLIAELDFLII